MIMEIVFTEGIGLILIYKFYIRYEIIFIFTRIVVFFVLTLPHSSNYYKSNLNNLTCSSLLEGLCVPEYIKKINYVAENSVV